MGVEREKWSFETKLLCVEWFKKNKQRLLDARDAWNVVAEAMCKDLGIAGKIGNETVRRIAKAAGVVYLPRTMGGGSTAARNFREMRAAMSIVTTEFVNLLGRLGEPVPPILTELQKSLSTKVEDARNGNGH